MGGIHVAGTDTEPVLDLAKTSPSIESLIKLSPSVELNEPPQDSRALLAHSQSLGRLGRRRGSTRDLSGPLTSSQTAPLATSTSDSGPLTAPPRKFLIDSSKKSTTPTTKDRTPSPMGRIEEQTEPPRTPDQLEQHGSKAMSSKSGGDAAVSSAGAVADTSPPSLEAMKCGLPAGATALSVFPALVPTGDVAVFSRTNSRSGPMDVPSGTYLIYFVPDLRIVYYLEIVRIAAYFMSLSTCHSILCASMGCVLCASTHPQPYLLT